MSTSTPERPERRHQSPASSSTTNSNSDQPNPHTNQRHSTVTAKQPRLSGSSQRHARNENARRSGGFLLRPAGAHAESNKNDSSHPALSHLYGFLGSKGKQRAGTHKSPPRSDPAEQPENKPNLSNITPQSDRDELRHLTDSAEWSNSISSNSAVRYDDDDDNMDDNNKA